MKLRRATKRAPVGAMLLAVLLSAGDRSRAASLHFSGATPKPVAPIRLVALIADGAGAMDGVPEVINKGALLAPKTTRAAAFVSVEHLHAAATEAPHEALCRLWHWCCSGVQCPAMPALPLVHANCRSQRALAGAVASARRHGCWKRADLNAGLTTR